MPTVRASIPRPAWWRWRDAGGGTTRRAEGSGELVAVGRRRGLVRRTRGRPRFPREMATVLEIFDRMSRLVEQGVEHLMAHHHLVLHVVARDDNAHVVTRLDANADLLPLGCGEGRHTGHDVPLDPPEVSPGVRAAL